MFYNLVCSLKTRSLCSLARSLQHISCATSVKGKFEKSFKAKLAALMGLFGIVSPFTRQRREPALCSLSWKSLCLEVGRDLSNITP